MQRVTLFYESLAFLMRSVHFNRYRFIHDKGPVCAVTPKNDIVTAKAIDLKIDDKFSVRYISRYFNGNVEDTSDFFIGFLVNERTVEGLLEQVNAEGFFDGCLAGGYRYQVQAIMCFIC